MAKLHEKNAGRGELRWSMAVIAEQDGILTVVQLLKGEGKLEERQMSSTHTLARVVQKDNLYFLVHTHSPTDLDSQSHPAISDGHFMWHNGMILPEGREHMKQTSLPMTMWDTAMLLNFYKSGAKNRKRLGEIVGSFACVYMNKGEMTFFRNPHAPLFYDNKDMAISSVPLPDMKKAKAGVFYRWKKEGWTEKGRFPIKYNPFGLEKKRASYPH